MAILIRRKNKRFIQRNASEEAYLGLVMITTNKELALGEEHGITTHSKFFSAERHYLRLEQTLNEEKQCNPIDPAELLQFGILVNETSDDVISEGCSFLMSSEITTYSMDTRTHRTFQRRWRFVGCQIYNTSYL